MQRAAEALADAITVWRAAGGSDRCGDADGSGESIEPGGPLVVALDGHGGAGKSTLAAELHQLLDLVLVHTDDFFRPPAEQNNAAGADQRPMARYYNWPEIRAAIGSLQGASLVLVEGVSSAAPALADLVDRAVLVQTPEQERLARLHARISAQEWDEGWLAAEVDYFASLPPDRFDLTVSGSGPGAQPSTGLAASP